MSYAQDGQERAYSGGGRWRAASAVRGERGGAWLGAWFGAWKSAPETWDASHRVILAVLLASAAFAFGVHGWRPTASGAATGRPSVAELERRVREAREIVAQLPSLQQAARQRDAIAGRARQGRAAPWQAMATLAARSGMTLRSLEPGAQTGSGVEAARPVRLAALGNFSAFYAFVRGLSKLPSLAVPVSMRVEREGDGLTLDVTLNVFESLPAAEPGASPGAGDGGQVWFSDPFDGPGRLAADDAREWRLTGLMRAGARGLAFFETDGAAAAYTPGQIVGRERLVRIDARGVTLAGEGGSRLLRFDAEAS